MHGLAEDVAEAVTLAAINSLSIGRIDNVREFDTPTMAERLAGLARDGLAGAAFSGFGIRRGPGGSHDVCEIQALTSDPLW